MFRLTIANQAWEPTSKVTRFAPSPPWCWREALGAAHPKHWYLPTSPSECAAPPNVAGRGDVRIKAESNAQNKQNTQRLQIREIIYLTGPMWQSYPHVTGRSAGTQDVADDSSRQI